MADFSDIFTGRLITEIPQALSAICDALVDTTSLVELNLSDNAFGGRVVDPMVPFLTQNTNLQIFRLNNNGLGPAGGIVIANALLEGAKRAKSNGGTPKLHTLICGRNRLENGSASAWAAAFAEMGTLKEVRMIQNGIRMEGIEQIVKGLRKNHGLEVLDLQDNVATQRGSRAIAGSIKFWPNLRDLNLNDLLLRPKGGIMLATAFAEGKNLMLESLRMQSDEVDARAIDILAGAVKKYMPKLKLVELNGNRFGEDDEAVIALKAALESHGNDGALEELDDVEEVDPEEEEEEEEDLEEEEEEEEAKEEKEVVAGTVERGGEDVRKNEADIVKEDKKMEEDQEPKQRVQDKEGDELADLMGKVKITNQ